MCDPAALGGCSGAVLSAALGLLLAPTPVHQKEMQNQKIYKKPKNILLAPLFSLSQYRACPIINIAA